MAPECHPALDLLHQGVPFSLLLDLALPVDSRELLREEGGDAGWLPAQRVA